MAMLLGIRNRTSQYHLVTLSEIYDGYHPFLDASFDASPRLPSNHLDSGFLRIGAFSLARASSFSLRAAATASASLAILSLC